jgi:hypothetical protein
MSTPQPHSAREHVPSSSALEDPRIPLQAKLAGAWTSFMFLALYVDYFQLYRPGFINDILAGFLWEFPMSQTVLTACLTLMAIPILMVVLSMVLPARANRAINLVVASLYVPISVFNVVGESWTFFYGLGAGLEVLLLALILRYAWTWPRRTTSPTTRAAGLDDEPLRAPQQA